MEWDTLQLKHKLGAELSGGQTMYWLLWLNSFLNTKNTFNIVTKMIMR